MGWCHAMWFKNRPKLGKSNGFEGKVNDDWKLWKFVQVLCIPYRLALFFPEGFDNFHANQDTLLCISHRSAMLGQGDRGNNEAAARTILLSQISRRKVGN